MERAVCYCRVSTSEQAREGVSLDCQEAKMRAYCALHDLEVAAVVREEGVSASKHLDRRAGGAEVLRMIARRNAAHVVVLKLDRLCRNAADCLTLTEKWDRAGVALHLVDYGGNSVDTASASGRLWLTMLAGFAEFERAVTAERTAAALQYKRDHREVYCPVPNGFIRDGDRLREHAGEMTTVRRIHSLAREGMSYSGIARKLNAEAVPAKRGGKWYPASVRYVAKNVDLYVEVPE
jgi:DNA invertase Pin-like site-specific DNA recombinase